MGGIQPFEWEDLFLESDLDSTSKLVLLVLRSSMRQDKPMCWLTRVSIARRASLSTKAVTKAIQRAIRSGWLEAADRPQGQSGGRRNYFASIPANRVKGNESPLPKGNESPLPKGNESPLPKGNESPLPTPTHTGKGNGVPRLGERESPNRGTRVSQRAKERAKGSAKPSVGSGKPSPVADFPLKDGSDYQPARSKVQEWEAAFPGVDVPAELGRARQWLRDNPSRRKTAKGMTRFLGSWLGKAADKAKHRTARDALTPEQIAQNSEGLNF